MDSNKQIMNIDYTNKPRVLFGLGKSKMYVLLGILCLLNVSCIRNLNLYDEDAPNKKEGEQGSQHITSETEFFYPFDKERQNNISEITLTSRIPLGPITASIPALKYNKSWLFMLTQDDCKQVAFSCTWAAINGKPLSVEYFYHLAHIQYGDLPPDLYYVGKTLGSTDGANNEVRFSFATTISPEWTWMDKPTEIHKDFSATYYRFFMKEGLVWGDVKEMLNYGIGIALHDMNISGNETAEEVFKHYAIAQDITLNKLSGRGCKALARPSGKEQYITAAMGYAPLQTMAAENGKTLYPTKVTTDLKQMVFNRGIYPIDHLKAAIEKQIQQTPENRAAVYTGVHGTDTSWVNFLLWLNNTYGKDGDDSVWMPSQEEYYEYNYYRIHGSVEVKQIDDYSVKLTVSLPSGQYFYYPSVTVNVAGLQLEDIASVESNETVTGLSYANYGEGLMLNIDCRKYLAEHAEHFVERYEKNRSDASAKADATYFVSMLKESAQKDALNKRIK